MRALVTGGASGIGAATAALLRAAGHEVVVWDRAEGADLEQLPGWVEGLIERTPLGRLGEADDVARVVAAVLGLEWVTGQIIHADGGLALHSPIDSHGQLRRVLGRPRG